MTGLINKILQKKIIIWGVGAIQSDIEALFPQLEVAYYVDDRIDEKGTRVPQNKVHKIFSSEQLEKENKSAVFVIVCEQNCDEILQRLDKLGLDYESDYCLYERVLYEYELDKFTKQFRNQKLVIWGVGKTFSDYRGYLAENSEGISFLIDGAIDKCNKTAEYLIYPSKEGLEKVGSERIVVTSTFYSVIQEELNGKGLIQGKDYIFVETFRVLCDYFHKFDDISYVYEERKKNSKHLLVVLAGYKEQLWDNVFKRIKKFVPIEYDVCILSSGKYIQKLSDICKKNEWSYISTVENKISTILNLAIYIHWYAEYIYKMDEDIFLTENVFEIMNRTYDYTKQSSRYEVGFVSPLIPINAYSYVNVLKYMNVEEEWKNRFGSIKITDGLHHHSYVLENPKVAKFLWEQLGNEGFLDEFNRKMNEKPLKYSICPIRYSIGMIMFSKELWINMKMFPDIGTNNMGMDEMHINEYCMMSGKVIVIAENAVVGHLGYKEQTKDMLECYSQMVNNREV